MKKNKISKKAIELDMLGWWIIAIVVLVILVFGFMIFKGKGEGAIKYILDLFRFGGK